MRNTPWCIVATLLIVSAGDRSLADLVAFDEQFSNLDQIDSAPEFYSDKDEYLGVLGLSPPESGFNGDAPPASFRLPVYEGFSDSYLVFENVAFGTVDLPVVLEWSNIDISGLSDLSFSGDFAATSDAFDTNPVEITGDGGLDYICVEIRIDNGAFDTVLEFTPVNTIQIAGQPGYQGDLSHDGGVTLLSRFVQNVSAAIPGTGNTLDLRLSLRFKGGNEAAAFDNLQVSGIAVPEASQIACLAIIGAGAAWNTRRNVRRQRA